MPCPHHDIKIIQRSNHQSAVASAAYQSGERLFSEYDQKQKYYSHKSEIVHTEIMLPPHAPPAYADRNTLWNAAEAIEKQWNSQLARRIVLAIPREIPPEQHADLKLTQEFGQLDEKGNVAFTERGTFLFKDPADAPEYNTRRFELANVETEIDWKPAAVPEPQKIKPIHLEALEGFIRFGGDGA